MGKPTTFLPPKMNGYITEAVNVELASKEYEPERVETERTRILREMISAYTAAEEMIKAHRGPVEDPLFRKAVSACFTKTGNVDVMEAKRMVDQMVYESQLKSRS